MYPMRYSIKSGDGKSRPNAAGGWENPERGGGYERGLVEWIEKTGVLLHSVPADGLKLT